jgi:hypothetical protein
MNKICPSLILAVLIGYFSAVSAHPQTTKAKTAAKPVEQYKVAREGVGIEGITVGKSTMADVVKKFGKNYKWTAHKKYSYSMAYPQIGLTFYMCQADKKREIFDIEIRQPFRAKTSRGIILGKSTVEDIYKIYGKSKDGLEYRGVSFFYASAGGRKTVTVIDIVENTGIRQCQENK